MLYSKYACVEVNIPHQNQRNHFHSTSAPPPIYIGAEWKILIQVRTHPSPHINTDKTCKTSVDTGWQLARVTSQTRHFLEILRVFLLSGRSGYYCLSKLPLGSNTGHRSNVRLPLAHRLRRWTNNNVISGQCLAFAGKNVAAAPTKGMTPY